MLSLEQQQLIRDKIAPLNPSLVGVFGSYARGEESQKSDIDILVDFNSKINLLDLIGLEQELSEVLGIKVDLVTFNSLNPLLKPYIEQDLIHLI